MAVISTKKDNRLVLEIDNGDLTKMQEVLKRWNFKDEQSFWRFSVSILLETEDKSLWIKSNGQAIPIAPAAHSIKGKDE
jgi:hypothetical protein